MTAFVHKTYFDYTVYTFSNYNCIMRGAHTYSREIVNARRRAPDMIDELTGQATHPVGIRCHDRGESHAGVTVKVSIHSCIPSPVARQILMKFRSLCVCVCSFLNPMIVSSSSSSNHLYTLQTCVRALTACKSVCGPCTIIRVTRCMPISPQ